MQEPVSRKAPNTFQAPKPSCKTAIRLFWKADLLTSFNVRKTKRIAKFDGFKTSALWRYKGNCGTRNRPVSRKSGKLFGSQKPFVKLEPASSGKLVFSYVVKGIKIKITAKFRASRRLRFEDKKKIMSPEMRPKSLGTFEKQAPGLNYSKPQFLQAWLALTSVNYRWKV